jgi:hypothetical protein
MWHDFKERLKTDPEFLLKIITEDHTWIQRFNIETKQQSSQWTKPSSPGPKKAGQVHSSLNSMPTVYSDIPTVMNCLSVVYNQL